MHCLLAYCPFIGISLRVYFPFPNGFETLENRLPSSHMHITTNAHHLKFWLPLSVSSMPTLPIDAFLVSPLRMGFLASFYFKHPVPFAAVMLGTTAFITRMLSKAHSFS